MTTLGILEGVTLEKAAALATPAAKRIFNNLLIPLLKTKITDHFKTKAAQKKFEENTISYLANLGGQCSIINTIAFQNTPKKLEDLYVPLTITDGSQSSQITVGDDGDIFVKGDRILVSDAAGMGKSTLSKKIALNILSKENLIPVFLELRKSQDTPFDIQVKKHIGIDESVDSEILNRLPLIYIFDGLDEIPNDLKKKTVEHLKKFFKEYKISKILLTSRHETYLSDFHDFIHYKISPLKHSEAYTLLKKYDPSGKISQPLIENIKLKSNDGIKDFLSTPLYVSLLFCSYRHKTILPQKKNVFYSQVYDALFESHDLSKEISYIREKHCKLDSSDFHAVLRRLAFWCLKSNGQLEFQKDELDIIVNQLLGNMNGITTNASSFTKDLTSTVPLFVKEGPVIRWSHKSLMEYFASMFICNDTQGKQEEILTKLFESEHISNYTNIFELCSDIDYTSFRSTIIKKILEDFCLYQSTHYKLITNKRISSEQIKTRTSLNYSSDVSLSKHPKFNIQNYTWNEENRHKNFLLKVTKRSPRQDKNINEMITSANGGNMHIFVYSENIHIGIIKIIKSKAPHLFLDLNKILGKSHIPDFPNISEYKWHSINDEPKNILNNSKNFETATKLLKSISNIAFDIERIPEELRSIYADTTNGIHQLIDDF